MHKTIKLHLLYLIIAISSIFHQEAKAQAVEEGNIIVDGFYGWPNFLNMYLRALVESTSTTATNVAVKGFGPLGGRFEYLLSDRIGFGIDISAANSKILWKDNTSGNNYQYEEKINRLRVFPRINIHFTNNSKLDFYTAMGVGYAGYKTSFKTNDPLFNTADYAYESPIPITMRLAIGFRYFISEDLGLNLEFGQLGPLGTIGISSKF